ncbi:CNBP [Mytilus edulis]|uniref:CNBP n=1 Tax=Mytilus edulis TaxID=6550 RepID=A0A8S3UD03_MYTED|nr:CNBP [Mytilus edulis]
MNERRCYNCAAIGQLANACPNEPYCSYCNIKGHPRRDCESFKQDQENQGYSKHGPEIFEGRQETKSDEHSDSHSVCDNDTFFGSNSAQINRLNQSATSVNIFIRKLCAREDNVEYVDLEKVFYKSGTIIRSMFDKADNSGVHVNTEGAQNINRKLGDFFHSPRPCVQELNTPMDLKRKRSDGTTTPTSADRMIKRSNTEPKKA